jgi:regulator of replication initiation timing
MELDEYEKTVGEVFNKVGEIMFHLTHLTNQTSELCTELHKLAATLAVARWEKFMENHKQKKQIQKELEDNMKLLIECVDDSQ